MSRDDEIEAIVEAGRRTRDAAPRWVWIAAVIVGVISATGFAVVMLGHREAGRPVARRSESGAGFGTGLLVGAGGGVVIGFALARHRRDHSSRKRP